ncbi:hypothetical protein DFR33_10549 [Bradymonas sediminis]|nr:hypothetical protein DFR33_10549 [Bradymonas sediminis]
MCMPTRSSKLGLLLISLAFTLWLSGCASYSDSMRNAHQAMAASQAEYAEQILNKSLETQSSAHLPSSFEGDNILLLLERATVLQSLGKYDLAARDILVVDDHMVFVSLSNVDSIDLATYLYSDDAKDYVPPAYERLLLNTLNMINYLAIGDIQGAKVESRRFSLMEKFFLDDEETSLLNGILALGNYLGGATFEHARDYSEAARLYSRAWHFGVRYPEFQARLTDLLYLTGYKPHDIAALTDSEPLPELMEEVAIHGGMTFEQYRQKWMRGDTLVVVQTGLAPWRKAQRVPIGAAMAYSSNSSRFSSDTQTQLNMMVASGAISTVNFPMLTTMGLPPVRNVTIYVDGEPRPAGTHIDVSAQVTVGYAHLLPNLMAAAITRMITRAVAGQVTDQAVQAGGGGGFGALAGLALQAGMSAADTPDTRSWMSLPGDIRILRTSLPEGEHSINIAVDSRTDERSITIQEDSLNIMNFSRIR